MQPTPQPRPTGREEIIAAVIPVAAKQLAEVGPTRMTMRTVAGRAGINHSLIHRHLGTKEHLVAAALDWLAQQSLDEARMSPAGENNRVAFGERPHIRRYVRALARCLLESPSALIPQTQFPVLENLIRTGEAGGLERDEAAARAVAVLCVAFGAEMFADFLSQAAAIGDGAATGPLDLLQSSLLSIGLYAEP